MTAIANLLVSLGAYAIGTLVRMGIVAASMPFGGYQSSYREGSMTMYFSSLTADLPLMASGLIAGLLCARFTTGRDFRWASIPALIYLLNGVSAFVRVQFFEMWLIMTGLQKLGTLSFGEIDKVLAGIAIAAGALIIMDR